MIAALEAKYRPAAALADVAGAFSQPLSFPAAPPVSDAGFVRCPSCLTALGLTWQIQQLQKLQMHKMHETSIIFAAFDPELLLLLLPLCWPCCVRCLPVALPCTSAAA